MDMIKVVLTSLFSIAVLFATAKMMGHKQVAQLDFFDYISGITIGSIAAEMATELEEPWQPLVALVVYGVVSVGLGLLTQKFPRTRKYINGSPSILMDNGHLYRKNIKKTKLDLSEFMLMCREQGYFSLSDIQTAVFEHNGKLSILPVSTRRPATPSDLKLVPPTEQICTEVIMDGRVLEDNLLRIGRNLAWLEKELKTQGYRRAKDVFLGLCDARGNVTLYRGE